VWSMLAWNAALGGGVRFAVGAWAPAPELRADVALDAGADLGRRIAEACGGFVTAMSYLHEPGAQPSRATVADAPAGGDELAFLCRETRWSVKERGPGSLAVDLDVPGAFHQALVEERQGGRVSVSVPVFEATTVRTEPASETCRQALGIFLARMCGVVRMARAAAESNAGTAPRFEVLHVQPTVAELDHGFAALSVAYRLAVQEAAVLWHDDTVASAYVRQWDDAVAHRAA